MVILSKSESSPCSSISFLLPEIYFPYSLYGTFIKVKPDLSAPSSPYLGSNQIKFFTHYVFTYLSHILSSYKNL